MRKGIIPVILLSGSKGRIIHRSTFTAENGLSLDAYNPDIGNSFVEAQGDWDIQENRARIINTTGVAITTTINSDVKLEAVISCGFTSDTVGLVFRYTDTSNFWFTRIRHSDSSFKLYELCGGIFFQRAVAYPTILLNTDYVIRVVVDGQSIAATLDGGNQISYALASFNQTAVLHGLYASAGVNSRHDDFIISTL
ncbi:MAG: hypothetical protein JXA42_08310 [Anaerolineales bacterium]|nr:hypothetical protein [Anaerolineales bacterium]